MMDADREPITSETTRAGLSPRNEHPDRLLNRNFVLLWQGQFVSQIGTQAFILAMMFWTMEATGSASLVGILMTLSALPGVLLGPLGGTVADRYSRKAIIIASDVVSGVGVSVIGVLFLWFSDAVELLVISLFLISILNGIVTAFFRPAILAAIPDLVPTRNLATANSMNQFSFQFSTVVGQSSGGVLYALLGAPVLFLIDGITFLFSAISESFISIPYDPQTKSDNLWTTLQAVKRDLMEGLRYVWHWSGMRNFLLMVGVVHLFAFPFLVLMPFFVQLRLGLGSDWYGFMMAAFSAGSVCGYVAAGSAPIGPARRGPALLVLLALAGLLFGSLGLMTDPYLAILTVFSAGTLLGIFNIHVMMIYQTASMARLRGRVMGLVMTIANAASPLGMLAGGIAADLTGKNIPLIFGFCGAMILVSVVLVGVRPSVLRFLSGANH